MCLTLSVNIPVMFITDKHSQINLEITEKKHPFKRIITFLSFLQYQSHPVIVVCTSMGTLRTGTANS